MKKPSLILCSLLIIGINTPTTMARAAASPPKKSAVTNYLQIPETMNFAGEVFHLAWSSHPTANYYKQEYVLPEENPEHYSKMLMIEVLRGNDDTKQALATKVAELKPRVGKDPVAHFDVIKKNNSDEYVLDFLMSEGKIVEWNAYRYQALSKNNGDKGIVLFAVSLRGYEPKAQDFLIKLKELRKTYRDAIAGFPLPKIQIAKP